MQNHQNIAPAYVSANSCEATMLTRKQNICITDFLNCACFTQSRKGWMNPAQDQILCSFQMNAWNDRKQSARNACKTKQFPYSESNIIVHTSHQFMLKITLYKLVTPVKKHTFSTNAYMVETTEESLIQNLVGDLQGSSSTQTFETFKYIEFYWITWVHKNNIWWLIVL